MRSVIRLSGGLYDDCPHDTLWTVKKDLIHAEERHAPLCGRNCTFRATGGSYRDAPMKEQQRPQPVGI
ncbi:MAG: hypothetical protein JRN06_05715 [Nitrososphaerota archaeon]|nr:hypothetical protein [Nitrososphaerota archaeon]MDG7024112.1 hypothetical protein [Nitrososphaerota archaeon]